MTYSDRRRIIRKYGFLLLAVLLIFVSGCGQEEEGYRAAAERREEAVGPAQYRDVAGTVWTDLWEMKIPGDRGAEEKVVNVKMNALVMVPNVEKMAVAEVKEFTFEKENVQMVVQGIFGDRAESYDERRLPKDILEKRLEVLERQVEEDEMETERFQYIPDHPDRDEIVERLEKNRREVTTIKGLIESAGEDFVREPAGEYQSDHYIGVRNGVEYLLSFQEDGSGQERQILLVPRREEDVWPEELKGMNTVAKRTVSRTPKENKVEYDRARKTAEDFLEKTGFSDTICSESYLLLWNGAPSENSGQRAQTVQRGCRFIYVTGACGLPFWNPGAAGRNYKDYSSETDYSLYTEIVLDVTESGVIHAEWKYPIMTTSVTDDVSLISFEDLKKIFREYIGECCDRQKIYEIEVTRLQLGYFRLGDPLHKGVYSYVPAWKTDGGICVINAIDGTVIHVEEGDGG